MEKTLIITAPAALSIHGRCFKNVSQDGSYFRMIDAAYTYRQAGYETFVQRFSGGYAVYAEWKKDNEPSLKDEK